MGLAYAAGGTAPTLRQGLLEGVAAGVGGTAFGASAVSALLLVVFRNQGDLPVVAGALDAAFMSIVVVGAVSGLVAAWAGAGFRTNDSDAEGP